MAKRKMTRKALDLAEHRSRLSATGAAPSPAAAWTVAFLALALALLLLFLLK